MPTETNGEEVCSTHLIPDSPASEDAFDAHRHVAAAMESLITSEPGGKCIGLAGRWGSGKSTVIHLLGNLLESQKTCKVWIFDAWAHEGDPLRRTFLEDLIERLSEVEWIDKERWKRRAEELARRRRIQEKRISPRLSRAGWIAAALTLLVPVGLILIEGAVDRGARLVWPPWSAELDLTALIGLILTSSPLLGAAIASGAVVGKALWKARSGGTKYQAPDLGEVLAPFVQREVTRRRTEMIETPEPTSIEFERTFRRLVAEALQGHDRNLVLVIDNLDRIAANDALHIWSTLQTFLKSPQEEAEWTSQFWVIMPHDPDSIKHLWESNPHPRETNRSHADPMRALAASFLDKTFHVTFDVPPPILSDRRQYLLNHLQAALPAHGQDEFSIIYRLFSILGSPQGALPTPRDIIIVVNQIGALHRQRGHEISLVHMAYYVLLRRSGKNVLMGLINGTLPGSEESGLLEDGVRDDLAALTFGVDPERASQLLLSDPVLEALAEGDGERLRELSTRTSGFSAVLEEVLRTATRDWKEGESGKLLHMVIALEESGVLEELSPWLRGYMKRSLGRAAGDVNRWAPYSDMTSRGVVQLVKFVATEECARRSFAAYGHSVEGINPAKDKAEAQGIAKQVLEVARQLDDMGFGVISESGVGFPGDMERYAEAIEAIGQAVDGETDSSYLQLLRPKQDAADVQKHFVSTIHAGPFAVRHFLALRSVQKLGIDMNWAEISEALQHRLSAGQTSDSEEANAVLGALLHIRDLPSAKQTLNSLASNGHLAHHIELGSNAKDWKAVARFLLAYMFVFPDLAHRGGAGQAHQGYAKMDSYLSEPPKDLVECLARLVQNYGDLGLLPKSADQNPKAGVLVGQTLAEIAAEDSTNPFFTPKVVMERWPLVSDHVDSDSFFAEWAHLEELKALLREDGFQPEYAGLYRAIVRADGGGSELQAWCAEGLQTLDSASWAKELERHGNVLQLAMELQQQGSDVDLLGSYRTALKEYAAKIADGTLDETAVSGEPVVKLLELSEEIVFRDELFEVATQRQGELSARFFEIFGSELAEAQTLKASNVTFTKLLQPLLSRRNVVGLAWLREALERDRDLLGDLNPDYAKVFRRELAEELRDVTEGEAQEVIEAIAELLRVKKSKRAKKAEEDQVGSNSKDEGGQLD